MRDNWDLLIKNILPILWHVYFIYIYFKGYLHYRLWTLAAGAYITTPNWHILQFYFIHSFRFRIYFNEPSSMLCTEHSPHCTHAYPLFSHEPADTFTPWQILVHFFSFVVLYYVATTKKKSKCIYVNIVSKMYATIINSIFFPYIAHRHKHKERSLSFFWLCVTQKCLLQRDLWCKNVNCKERTKNVCFVFVISHDWNVCGRKLNSGLNYVKLFTKIYIKVPYRYTHLIYSQKGRRRIFYYKQSLLYRVIYKEETINVFIAMSNSQFARGLQQYCAVYFRM